jgi:hypothetical protein
MLFQLRLAAPRVKWNLGRDPWKTHGTGIPLYTQFSKINP